MTPRPRPEVLHERRLFVLDSEALSKAVGGDRVMLARINKAWQSKSPVVTSALTTLEAWDPRQARMARLWERAMSRIAVVHTDETIIAEARSLLKGAGLHGHKYAIDAVLAAVALAQARRGGQVTVLTSDVDDLERLLAGHPVVVAPV
ncbi:PIN domain-containing protein [Streptomyces sp. NBC_01006]|uniref:PIN domain-containing protein n=1 Tax=Streptomyces sp. NBC_01006 TaxID=2903716 RepID=UPI00386B76F0|nr:PIN domain-containing protein [Streptomyces sp. NBC_01006]